jgi:hypothetical protein
MHYREWAAHVQLVLEGDREQQEREEDVGPDGQNLDAWYQSQQDKGGFGKPPPRSVLDKLPRID